ncbi:non-canonical purine NTP pyrophosphatase [Lentzea sp. JNUCC 0626]|uniref:non-canonical purine NTP pyrophosphatase n=1 Tax=Lentzea sp. JNUCC 0626 TaxID=3367513 RepID=UPI00374832B2
MTIPEDSVLTTIYFATSNLGKLAQARLVLRQHGFEVAQMLTHRNEYTEPYGLEREEFLSVGLREIIDRAGGPRIVFIEDTTVRIHALSKSADEFPGQQTKEWFAGTTHAELVAQIEDAGGDRTATVRSDIALHVPELGRFVFFSGVQTGAVADVPATGDSNVAYPWLGKRDFSSWFVPAGGNRPLAAMSYEESRKFDYRERCLHAVAVRLQEYQAVGKSAGSLFRRRRTRVPGQMSLVSDLRVDSLVVVVGKIGAGKTTIGRYLTMAHDLPHLEGSALVAKLAAQQGINGRSGFELADELFDRCGRDAVERLAVWPEFERGDGPLVYTGARTLEGLLYLKKKADEAGRRCVVWFVEATDMSRHVRIIERVREGDDVAPQTFANDSARDMEYGAAKYADVIADCYIGNTKGVSELLDAAARAVVAQDGEFGKPALTSRRNAVRRALDAGDLEKLLIEFPDLVTSTVTLDGALELTGRGTLVQELVDMTPPTTSKRRHNRYAPK